VHADITMPLPLMCVFSHRLPSPLIRANSIAHEISRALFAFKREGLLETVGPAGANAMQQLFVHFTTMDIASLMVLSRVQGMVDQLSGMERIVNTPIPKVMCVLFPGLQVS
jgi:putative membrane protein